MMTASSIIIVKNHELEFTHSNSLSHTGINLKRKSIGNTKDRAVDLGNITESNKME